MEVCSSRGIHSFLGILAFGIDPVSGFSVLALLVIYREGAIHLLHSLLYFLLFVYTTTRHIFACLDDFPTEVLPTVVEVPVNAFLVRRVFHSVPRANHESRLGGVP